MSTATQECSTIQIIEPDSSSPVETIGGAISDPAISERGEVSLVAGQTIVTVSFVTAKLSAQYRFEYLYIDDFNFGGGDNNPGAIIAVPTVQTVTGFTVELSGMPLVSANAILRWHVVVVSTQAIVLTDAPERLYIQLPFQADPDATLNPSLNILFVNPRSTYNYGFSELRVENLVDLPQNQTPISVQVWQKRLDGCQIAINPLPPNGNYYLTLRTP